MHRRIATHLVLAIAALAFSQRAAAYLVFTDRAAWELAVGAVTTETFANPIALAQSITFDSGIISTAIGTDTVLGDSNTVSGGQYHGRVDSFNAFANTYDAISWIFPGAISAFGGDWSSVATHGRLTLAGEFDGAGIQTVDMEALLGTPGDGFLGVVGSGSFSSFTFGTRLNNDEAFAVDNFSFTGAAPGSAPEPAPLALVVLGLMMIALRRRT